CCSCTGAWCVSYKVRCFFHHANFLCVNNVLYCPVLLPFMTSICSTPSWSAETRTESVLWAYVCTLACNVRQIGTSVASAAYVLALVWRARVQHHTLVHGLAVAAPVVSLGCWPAIDGFAYCSFAHGAFPS
ncbi:hypothetical protein COO60DRAFT_1491772, partial [Scenedesmus sp. NREL 46B-D3]